MGVGMGDIAAGEEKTDPPDAVDLLHHPGEPLPQMQDFGRKLRRQIIEIVKMLARHDLEMAGPDRMDVEKGVKSLVPKYRVGRELALGDGAKEACAVLHLFKKAAA